MPSLRIAERDLFMPKISGPGSGIYLVATGLLLIGHNPPNMVTLGLLTPATQTSKVTHIMDP